MPHRKIEIMPIKTPLIEKGMDIAKQIVESAKASGIEFQDEDIIAVADKILSASEGRIFDLSNIKPSSKALDLAEKTSLEPGFVELVLREAEKVYGWVYKAILTIKHGVLVANAGLDHKNVPLNHASLWPENPNTVARTLRFSLQRLTGKRLGVLVVDSHVLPLRLGTVGFALGIAGFEPVRDCRGMLDLYGKPLLITRINLADDLASAAHLVMGESDESIPAVVIRGAPVKVTDNYDPEAVRIPADMDLFMSIFKTSGVSA
jgi:coenzyme F420-0:L-glutamate ligase